MFSSIYAETQLLDIACNALLVEHNIRPAFLIYSSNHEKLEKTLNSLKKYFQIFETTDAFVITKHGNKILLDRFTNFELYEKRIGEIIGYPCAGDLSHEERRKYVYSIYVSSAKRTEQLIAVICGENMDNWFGEKVKTIRKLFERLKLFVKVKFTRQNLYTNQQIIEKIKKGHTLNREERMYVTNELRNREFNIVNHFYDKRNIDIFKFPKLLLLLISDVDLYFENNDERIIHQINILKSHFNVSIGKKTIKYLLKNYDR